jgi:hypothetical protein
MANKPNITTGIVEMYEEEKVSHVETNKEFMVVTYVDKMFDLKKLKKDLGL